MLPIEIHDVTLTYDTPGGKVPGVKDVSFNIDASEFLCIVGPSGCGKSIDAPACHRGVDRP